MQPQARWTGLTCPQCGAPTATTAPEPIDPSTAFLHVPPPGEPPWIEWCTGTCLRLAMGLTPTLGDPPEPDPQPAPNPDLTQE